LLQDKIKRANPRMLPQFTSEPSSELQQNSVLQYPEEIGNSLANINAEGIQGLAHDMCSILYKAMPKVDSYVIYRRFDEVRLTGARSSLAFLEMASACFVKEMETDFGKGANSKVARGESLEFSFKDIIDFAHHTYFYERDFHVDYSCHLSENMRIFIKLDESTRTSSHPFFRISIRDQP
jgi:hypothetical protein